MLNGPIENIKFCDIGINMFDERYGGKYNGQQKHQEDTYEVLRRASTYGVKKAILTGVNLMESSQALQFCRTATDFDLYCTVGVHPTMSNDFINKDNEIVDGLENLILDGYNDRKVVALGECGLDYDRLQYSSKEQQMKGFLYQLDLAEKLPFDLPLFLHNRNTNGDFIDVIRENRHKLRKGGVVHSFDGNLKEMKEIIELGLHIGLNGCSLRTEESLDVVRHIPAEFLLLETDAPYCSIKQSHPSFQYVKTKFDTKKPEKYESGYLIKDRNEPCTMIQVLEVVAAIRQEDPQTLADTVYDNSQKLFFQ